MIASVTGGSDVPIFRYLHTDTSIFHFTVFYLSSLFVYIVSQKVAQISLSQVQKYLLIFEIILLFHQCHLRDFVSSPTILLF